VINYAADRYDEVVTDPETGTVIRECHQPCRNIAGAGPRGGRSAVPRWFQHTEMYDEARLGSVTTRSRFGGRMRGGNGWCVDADVDS
jgi:hypothetical protein